MITIEDFGRVGRNNPIQRNTSIRIYRHATNIGRTNNLGSAVKREEKAQNKRIQNVEYRMLNVECWIKHWKNIMTFLKYYTAKTRRRNMIFLKTILCVIASLQWKMSIKSFSRQPIRTLNLFENIFRLIVIRFLNWLFVLCVRIFRNNHILNHISECF